MAWSNVSGGQLIVLQPRSKLNVLGVLSNGSFAGRGGAMLPGSAAGYRELQYALRSRVPDDLVVAGISRSERG